MVSGMASAAWGKGGLLIALGLLLASAGPLHAQEDEAVSTEQTQPDDPVAAIEARRAQTQADYERALDDIKLSEDRMASISAGIATLKKDSASVTAALIQAAKTEKKLAEDVEEISGRLVGLRGEEDGIKASLEGRRAVLAEVLAALQRMGLNPPPAILVKPEDALSSVRSAILLGAVVPELRQETETLLADLRELSRVAASIEAERGRLNATAEEQVAEKQRLSMLLEEKQRLQTQSEAVYAAEQKRSEQLAASASSFQELIANLEKEGQSARAAAEAAAKAEVERLAREEAELNKPIPEAYRLSMIPFAALKGQMSLPATGRRTARFGEADNNGGVRMGDTITTQSGAIVTAPAGGSVLYAGPFRSYGQLLILNAGDGYHVVLAGMGRISVTLGQAVLAGEPIGAMGETRVAGPVPLKDGSTGPDLYVEFRKDGKPVDPTPWWSERIAGRTANDS